MRKVKLATLIFAVLIFFAGCSGKQDEIYNKPAEFWYEQIIYDIKDSDLEAADKHFASMSAEHVSSPLVEQAMMILAQAHAQVEEYILANFYFDEYIKRYSDGSRMEYIKYLKIKANFDSFAQPARNQQLLLDTIEETKVFLQEYPDSIYIPLVNTILVKLSLGEYYLEEEIASLYKRTGREVSAEIYEKMIEEDPLRDANMIDPTIPWYRVLFE